MTDGGKIHEVSHLVPLVHTHITKFADHPHKLVATRQMKRNFNRFLTC